MKQVDYLIVGQGIAGTMLTFELLKAGKSVYVLNHETGNTSSNKAGGLYNPITGRQMVKTWLADEIFPFLEENYKELELLLGERFIYPKPIYRPFFSVEEQNDWQGKAQSEEYKKYIKVIHSGSLEIPGLVDGFGGLELNFSGSVDLPKLISVSRAYFTAKGIYHSEMFDYERLVENEDGIVYKDVGAAKIIFCEGPAAINNPFSSDLPFSLVKGEILDVKTDLPDEMIVNRGVFILPKAGYFKVGSTYDHHHLDYLPTAQGQRNIETRLQKIYNAQFEVLGHSAGVRPATYDRRPFIGLRGLYEQVGIFNGFGTKGVSLVPFFATQFVNYLLGRGDLYPEVDLKRVSN